MLKFIMLIHNHQPIGNFDYVMEKSYNMAYKPFLDIFADYDVKISLHISGPLFDWLMEHHQEYIEKVTSFVKSGRIEIVGSGYYEPILAAIPEDDAVNQILLFKDSLEKVFGTRVRGSWLTERVWEPQLPKIFKQSKIDYIVTDDYHFLRSGIKFEQLDGYYLTDYDNNVLAIYPGSEKLRYILPFSTIDNIYKHFKDAYQKGIKTLIFADDGEKFGIWPETYKWVYEENWLRNFFQFIVDNKDWIETTTINEHFSSNKPKGCCFLPTTSYPELGEWALPSDSSIIYKKNLDFLKSQQNFSEFKPFFQGGQWKNFLAKYPESRIIYRKMHYVSEIIRNKPLKEKKELFKSQCNDAYWHGIFGGLYLPHLRREINTNLVIAMKKALGKSYFDLFDLDLDGEDEILIKNESLALMISPKDGGTLFSIDFLENNLNLTDTITRCFEPYHLKIKEADRGDVGTKTIHEQFKAKEDGLDKLLVYDSYKKSSFRTFVFKAYPEDLEAGKPGEIYDIATKGYSWQRIKVKNTEKILLTQEDTDVVCKKTILLNKNAIHTDVNISSDYHRFAGVEWNFNLFAPDAPDRYVFINDQTKLPLNFKGTFDSFSSLSIIDEWLKVRISFEIDKFSSVVLTPIYTVSLSESGVEKTFQGTSLYFLGEIKDGSFSGNINIKIDSL